MRFEFCLPTLGEAVPAGAEWFHEIKNDGYRLRIERDGERVRLITKGGHDWAKRFPWIVEAALKNRTKQFIIDGEAVILASTAFPTSTRCIPADITVSCNFVRSTCLRSVAKISEPCRSPCVRPIWSGFSAADQTGSLSTRLKLARSGQTYSSRLPYRVGRCQPA